MFSPTVMVPSAPTFSMASAISVPMDSSPAEIVATRAMSLVSVTDLLLEAMALTAALEAFSMPRFSASGAAPAATFFMPSLTSAWASTVAVVVPSPAMSLVLVATSRIN